MAIEKNGTYFTFNTFMAFRDDDEHLWRLSEITYNGTANSMTLTFVGNFTHKWDVYAEIGRRTPQRAKDTKAVIGDRLAQTRQYKTF